MKPAAILKRSEQQVGPSDDKDAGDLTDLLRNLSEQIAKLTDALDVERRISHEETVELREKLQNTKEESNYWETRYTDEVLLRNEDVQRLKSSTSWRITWPLRGAKRLLTEPGYASSLGLSVAKFGVRRLPIGRTNKRRLAEAYRSWRTRYQHPRRSRRRDVELLREPDLTDVGNDHSSRTPKSIIVPEDGRWNVDSFESNKAIVARYFAALSRQRDMAEVRQDDIDTPVANTGPLVSVIVRTFEGRARLLSKALDSIVAQSYRPIEIVIVQDGGSDLKDLVMSYEENAEITVSFNEISKGGRSRAANRGLEVSQGTFVNFLDDDDQFLPSHIARLVGCAERRPELAAVYSAALEVAADIDPKTGTYQLKDRGTVFLKDIATSMDLLKTNAFPIQAIMFRKSIRGVQHRFDTDLDALEDWLFWIQMLVGHRIRGISDVTSVFHVPRSVDAKRSRYDAHIEAEHHFNLKRAAFIDAYQLKGNKALHEDSQAVKSHARNWVANTGLDELVSPHPVWPRGPIHHVLFDDKAPQLSTSPERQIAAFTSVNLGYIPKALAWARSVKEQNPDWETHILLNDALPDDCSQWPNVDFVYPIGKLGIPNFHAWSFGMRVVELCTATKAFYARRLLEHGYRHVIYFDPDTYAFSDLSAIIDEFGDDEVLVTPHCTQSSDTEEEIQYNEVSSLAHGIFNLGFLGLRQGPNARRVVDFWCRRMVRHCVDDHGRGLFTDQKWFNLVPIFFDRVKVVKDKGWNTASWNIASRPINMSENQWFAGDDPLLFFHFSGYDADVPKKMFDVFARYDNNLKRLLSEYESAHEFYARQPFANRSKWALSSFDDGTMISDAHRIIYRSNFENQSLYPEPFFTAGDSFLKMFNDSFIGSNRLIFPPKGYIRQYY
ncbi:MAG: glycosyltransferase [Pseudomonadota bacterium]